MSELMTVIGSVTGTGVYTLDSDLFHSPAAFIRIPKGMKAKVWCKRIAGEAADVAIEYTEDVTAAAPVWKVVDFQRLAAPGELSVEKRRPIVLHSTTGKEALRISRLSGTGPSYVDVELEFEE